MMDKKERAKLFRKYGITARKYQGDDQYSWAVFVGGRPILTGLSHYEVGYYKDKALADEQTKEKGDTKK